jgi:hypothetical protein
VTDLSQVAWFAEEDPQKRRQLLGALHAAATRSHERAAQVLAQHRVKAFPFALLLRGFKAEGFSTMTGPRWTSETGLEPWAVSMAATQPSSIERAVAEAVGDRCAVVPIANQQSMLFESAWLLPRMTTGSRSCGPSSEPRSSSSSGSRR